ncbi:MAG TPA: hypothetical protein ENN81_07230 [Phycisphaerales bacterium]|nr:hypothetical protein [Phycisphaerales bacterium]
MLPRRRPPVKQNPPTPLPLAAAGWPKGGQHPSRPQAAPIRPHPSSIQHRASTTRTSHKPQPVRRRMLQKFARTLQIHRRGLLAWSDHPISTGPLEGTNNKIKTMQRQAYGYRDQEFFNLKIHAIHTATYALAG